MVASSPSLVEGKGFFPRFRTVRPVRIRSIFLAWIIRRNGNHTDYPTGMCLALIYKRHSWQGDRQMRTLMNRCGDRELLWVLMAVVGAIVVAINS